MEEINANGYNYEGRECPLPDLRDVKVFPGGIEIKALFQPECKWKLVEEYGPWCYVEQEDGRLLFQSNYANKDYLFEWLFSFRDRVEVIEPEEIRQEMKLLIENMRKIYR